MAKVLVIAGMAGMLTLAGLLYLDPEAEARAPIDCGLAAQDDPGYCD